MRARFWDYRQNNSGGSFDYDATTGITLYVIVEATSPSHADARAQEIGLYFNGCDAGRDCSCCGDRWSTAYGDGDAEPSIYGKPAAEEAKVAIWRQSCPLPVCVHYMDGRKEWLS